MIKTWWNNSGTWWNKDGTCWKIWNLTSWANDGTWWTHEDMLKMVETWWTMMTSWWNMMNHIGWWFLRRVYEGVWSFWSSEYGDNESKRRTTVKSVKFIGTGCLFVFFLVGFMVGNGESAAKQGYQPSPSCGKPNTELARIYKKLCVRMNHQKTMPKIGGFKVLFQIRWFSSCFMRGNRFWRWS
jgi:hypothetical protein